MKMESGGLGEIALIRLSSVLCNHTDCYKHSGKTEAENFSEYVIDMAEFRDGTSSRQKQKTCYRERKP